jgi:hypothetical protein
MQIEATKHILRTSQNSTVATSIETYDNNQTEPLQHPKASSTIETALALGSRSIREVGMQHQEKKLMQQRKILVQQQNDATTSLEP